MPFILSKCSSLLYVFEAYGLAVAVMIASASGISVFDSLIFPASDVRRISEPRLRDISPLNFIDA